MTTTIIIPARMASTRLPNKMLLCETGWPLIRHVYEQAKKSKLATRVVIATDHDDIASAVRAFGGDVVMTNPNHPSGTDRLAEVVMHHITDSDIVINVQGDEPEIEPEKIDRLITLFKASDAAMGTLVTRFPADKQTGNGSPLDPNCVKAVLGAPVGNVGFEALYFSRSLVPYPRDDAGAVTDPTQYFMHLGIYAYRPAFLKTFVGLPQGKLEMTEKLEQLRILENGYKIVAGIVENATPGIDTRSDYDAFVARWKARECAE
jgi:3-deoxy-manno-octulosonate cytidylyltransferase (CMP-KDO synthetase)